MDIKFFIFIRILKISGNRHQGHLRESGGLDKELPRADARLHDRAHQHGNTPAVG